MRLLVEALVAFVALAMILVAWGAARVRKRIPLVLGLLSASDVALPGRRIATMTGIPWHAIYPLLAHMEDLLLIEAEERPGGPERGGLPKRFYSITPAGRARLSGASRRPATERKD